jgi:methylthioribulose-1-phosphate dehydratase
MMNEEDPHWQQAVTQLVGVGRFFFKRGWVPATSGNFSVRLSSEAMAITVSGWHKGALSEAGIMCADMEGHPLTSGKQPSAEILLHAALYRRASAIGAVLHTHSVYSTVLSQVLQNELVLTDYEVLKALPGIKTHQATVRIPIFPNGQNMHHLAATVDTYLDQYPASFGYLIAGHGLYTWGRSLKEVSRYAEAFEFLFECEVLRRRLLSL